jgi:hypothetical protein
MIFSAQYISSGETALKTQENKTQQKSELLSFSKGKKQSLDNVDRIFPIFF